MFSHYRVVPFFPPVLSENVACFHKLHCQRQMRMSCEKWRIFLQPMHENLVATWLRATISGGGLFSQRQKNCLLFKLPYAKINSVMAP